MPTGRIILLSTKSLFKLNKFANSKEKKLKYLKKNNTNKFIKIEKIK